MTRDPNSDRRATANVAMAGSECPLVDSSTGIRYPLPFGAISTALIDVQRVFEQHDASISQRVDRRDVAAFQAAAHARALAFARQLNFGNGAGAQTQLRFEQRCLVADIEQGDRNTGPQHGAWLPPRMTRRTPAAPPALDEPDRYCSHCRVGASNINTRIRLVAPK